MIRFQHLCFLVVLGFLLATSESIRFDLQSGHTKCIAEDIKSNSMTVGKYSVVNPNDGQPLPDSHKLTARVYFLFSFLNNYFVLRGMDSGLNLIRFLSADLVFVCAISR